MKNSWSSRGFTLIELILVTAMLAVVGLAIYTAFVSGVQIWQRVTRTTETEDVALFFKNISYDLRNSFKLGTIRFRGEHQRVSFPTRIKHHTIEGVEDSIGKVTYAFDRRNKTLEKVQADYSEVYRKKAGVKRTLATGVASLSFEYYVFDAEREKYSWVTNWQARDEPFGREIEYNLPLIVKIEVGLPDGDFEKKFVKTVYIPTACCWPFMEEKDQ